MRTVTCTSGIFILTCIICATFMLLSPKTSLQYLEKKATTATLLQPCEERRHVAFLKVHKAGSTTIMNIIQRFGEKRSLICAIPSVGNYLGWGKTIVEGILIKPPPGKSYNLLFNHVVYNRTVFRRVMPSSTVYVAIVREPLDLLESAIRFLQERFLYIKKIPEDKLSNFLKNPLKYEPLKHEMSFTNNRMAYDFGLSPNLLHSREDIHKYLLSISEDFDIVLLMEYFDESIVLLKRKLCWTFEDIIYVKNNVNMKRSRGSFSQEVRKAHKAWAIADIIFYDFFYAKFWKTVQQEKDFFMEVKEFKKVLGYVHEFCKNYGDNKPIDLELLVEKTDFSPPFVVRYKDCKLMKMLELNFLELTRQRHMKAMENESIQFVTRL